MENNKSNNDNKEYSFDSVFLKRFIGLHKILFNSKAKIFLFLMTFGTAFVEQFLAYHVGLISGQFFKVLGDKDLEAFQWVIIESLALILTMALVLALKNFLTDTLVISWRRGLTLHLHENYFANINYYKLNFLHSGDLDNPDQRMTADVSSLVTDYGSIITNLILAPFLISYYTYQAFTRAGWIGPTGMFALFLLSTVVNKILMSPIVNLTFKAEKKEGDFRFKHVQIRTQSESMAFQGSSDLESSKANQRLKDLLFVRQKLVNRKFLLNLATNSFDYLGSIASYLVISVPIFAGVYDDLSGPDLARIISENSFVCMYLVFQFSKLVNMSPTFSRLAGVTHRIAELNQVLEDGDLCDDDNDLVTVDSEDDDDESGLMEENEIIRMENFSLKPPNSQNYLVQNLNLRLFKGQNLLMMGPSSSGKTSILRAMRKLWRNFEGRIKINEEKFKIYFLPQKSSFTDGTLRDQITYPEVNRDDLDDATTDEEIYEYLSELNLNDLVARCGGDLDSDPGWQWQSVLSPGEMQRLAFIRLWHHKPDVAVLDEATSAISTAMEQMVYQKCLDMNMTLLSVGHREALKRFHSYLLEINGNTQWTLSEI